MDRKEYCDRVLAQVGRLTTDEANDLRNELAGHIEDHAEALVEHGYTEDAAYGRAVALMGDPEETGRALRAQYGGWWLGEVIDEWEDCDYPSCVSSSGTLYVCIASHRVNIEPDDTYIRLIYDRLGEHVALEIPLPGREAQP